MPKYNCCVPGCINSHRNKPADFKFYCIPKDPELRQKYVVILRNETLKVDSSMTRVCADHWEGGEKLSGTHLPTIFPWSVSKTGRRSITKFDQSVINTFKRKRKLKDNNEAIYVKSESTYADIEPENRLDNSVEVLASQTQTDLGFEKLLELEEEVQALRDELHVCRDKNQQLQSELDEAKREIRKLDFQIKNSRFDIDKFKHSNKDIEFYTGLPNYSMLLTCYSLIEKQANNLTYGNQQKRDTNTEGNDNSPKVGRPRLLTKFQEFVMVLMRLRLGLFERDLAHRFGISEGSVSVIIRRWITFLRCEFGPLIRLPEKDIIYHYCPQSFKTLCPDVVLIVDCTEIEMERPSALNNQSACYSQYKSRPTMKALLGITPSGVLAFVSDFFPGSISDKEITTQSNFLDILHYGDAVMADKGFNVQDELAADGVRLVRPEFLTGKKQFSAAECNKNKMIASLRIHVESLMERIKNWHILDHKMPITMASHASDILVVIGVLSNFLPPLIS